MIDTGLGERQLNSLLSLADIPTISSTTLKKHERIVGLIIEEITKESCVESIRLEKQLSIDSSQEE